MTDRHPVSQQTVCSLLNPGSDWQLKSCPVGRISSTLLAAVLRTLFSGANVVIGRPARTTLQQSSRESTGAETSLAVSSLSSWRRTDRIDDADERNV